MWNKPYYSFTQEISKNTFTQDQTVCFAFGNGIYGQLGTCQSRNSYSPVRVKLDNIDHFAAG